MRKSICFFLMCFCSFLFSQQKVKINLSNPNTTIYTHLYFLQKDSYNPEKSSVTIQGYKGKQAIEKAIKLKQILDGRGLFVDFSKIPTNPNFNDTIGYIKKHKYVLFPERLPIVYLEKVNDKWFYSKETIKNIEFLYKEIYPWYILKIKKLIPNRGYKTILGIQIWKFIGLIFLLVCSVILFFFVKKIVFFIFYKIQYKITRSNNDSINIVLKKLSQPISLLLAIGLLDSFFPSLQFNLKINTFFFLGLNIIKTFFWIYIFLKVVHVFVSIYAEYTKHTRGKLDDQLVPILHNFLSVLVFFIGILKLLTLLGLNLTTVLAGVSIGGLAVALASQDTVKNLIGTVMIFLDKPFHIGDWIEADNISGEVEEVGFRSTRIRSADTSIYQIPNSRLSELTINNKGLRKYRRYKTNIGLRYDTPPELIEGFVRGLREIIIAYPETRSESYNVEFTGFGDSALMILVNVYFKSLGWGIEQSSKHRLHIAILKLAKELGVDFAFPSTTLMIEQFPEKTTTSLCYNTNQDKIEKSIKNVISDFLNKN